MKAAAPAQKSRRGYSKHGLTTLKRAVNGLGNRVIDRRTATGKSLAKFRRDLIADLGGDISTQQSALIDLVVKSKLLLDSIDTWLLVQPSLVNARRRTLLPVVLQRQQLADGLARYLGMLGLERKMRTKTLDELLAEDEPERVKARGAKTMMRTTMSKEGSSNEASGRIEVTQ